MATIRVKTGPNKGRTFEIRDTPLTVGREENQVIQILDQGVSRGHAEIFRLGEMCFVRDLHSTNGTYVNDVKITEESLKAGDELLIGTTILVFEDNATHRTAGEGVEFEGEENARIESTTVELKVDSEKALRAIGKEVQSRNLTLISQLGRILRTEHDLMQAYEKTLELLTGALGASQAYLFWIEPGGKIVPKVVVESEESGADKKVSRTIVNRVHQSMLPLLTTDAALDDRFSLSESIILRKIKSVICVPLLIDEKVEGLLYFHSSKVDHTLTPSDLELVTSASLQLSMATALSGTGERLRTNLMATIRSLVTAIEAVDPRGPGHVARVADYSAVVAAQLKMCPLEVHRVRLAALLHDVGKLAVRGLPPEQARIEHVAAGEKILTGIEGFEQILPGIRYHHERADGSGFPYKIKNAETPMPARILIVTNAFDDACTGGPEGKGQPAKDVVKDMARRGGAEFDDEVIKALILCHRNGSLYGGAAAHPE